MARRTRFVATHVTAIDLDDANDSIIWDHAIRAHAIIVTKDEDFAERTARSTTGPVIIWLRIGNSTKRSLTEWLEPRWPTIMQLLNDGHRLIEVR